MSQRYFENFKDVADVIDAFCAPLDAVADAEIVYAYYGDGDYCGSATVLFQRDGKLYEVSGSHCSCNGLEGLWEPKEVSWDQLAMRDPFYFEDDKDGNAKAALLALIAQHVPTA